MAFRSRAKINTGLKQLRSTYRDRDPEALQFYPSKNPKTVSGGKAVSRKFNSLALPYRYQFLLKAYGKPFKYQGVVTKQYTVKTLMLLFGVSERTLRRWVEFGVLEAPFITLKGQHRTERSYWFYHQVQPVYSWFLHLKARGLQVSITDECKFSLLRTNKRRARRRFEQLLGIEEVDEYTKIAGKYGVIPLPVN
jgi:hypothetical protein